MSDLINRQTAILQLSHNKCGNDENDIAVQHDIETIRKLPSTEPKIVRCKDCAYYNWDCIDAPYGMTEMIRWCDLHYDAGNENLEVNPDDYCKWGKRRADGTQRRHILAK